MLLLTTFIWGGNAVAGRLALGHVSPMILTFCRWSIAFCIIAIIARKHLREDWPVIRANWKYLLLTGGVGYVVFNYSLYSALQYISAINVTLEQSAMPLLIFLFSFIFFKTKISFLQFVGFGVTVVGILVIVSAGDPIGFLQTQGEGLNRGDLFMLGAAVSYAGYSVAIKLKPDMHWQSLLTALVGAAFIFSTVGAGFEIAAGNAVYPFSTQGILVALFAGIFPSLVSQGLYIAGIEKLGANAAGLYINMVPVFGAILAVLILGEAFYLYHLAAFVLVVGGILIAQKNAPSLSKDGA